MFPSLSRGRDANSNSNSNAVANWHACVHAFPDIVRAAADIDLVEGGSGGVAAPVAAAATTATPVQRALTLVLALTRWRWLWFQCRSWLGRALRVARRNRARFCAAASTSTPATPWRRSCRRDTAAVNDWLSRRPEAQVRLTVATVCRRQRVHLGS